jgi:hypothetical protein
VACLGSFLSLGLARHRKFQVAAHSSRLLKRAGLRGDRGDFVVTTWNTVGTPVENM